MGRSVSERVDVTCLNCGYVWSVRVRELEWGRGKFCSKGCSVEYRSSLVDRQFFSEPNADMAYVLGLVISDGCICLSSRGREYVAIKSIDLPLLEMVREMMQSQYAITDCGRSSSGNIVWRIRIANKQVVDDLKRWGVTPRKTFTTSFPKLPGQFVGDFIRGVFDGDGTVGSYQYGSVDQPGEGRWALRASILGTASLLTPMVSVFGGSCRIVPYKKINKLIIGSHESLVSAYLAMYHSDDVRCLERKRTTFREVLNVIDQASRKPRYGTQKSIVVRGLLESTGLY